MKKIIKNIVSLIILMVTVLTFVSCLDVTEPTKKVEQTEPNVETQKEEHTHNYESVLLDPSCE